MSSHKDLQEMVDILGLAVVRQETEEQFFRRSAEATTDEVARGLLLEIAEDLRKYVDNLEDRKRKIADTLKDLAAAEQTATTGNKAQPPL